MHLLWLSSVWRVISVWNDRSLLLFRARIRNTGAGRNTRDNGHCPPKQREAIEYLLDAVFHASTPEVDVKKLLAASVGDVAMAHKHNTAFFFMSWRFGRERCELNGVWGRSEWQTFALPPVITRQPPLPTHYMTNRLRENETRQLGTSNIARYTAARLTQLP